MKASKFLSITTLVVLSFLLTAFTWAYWANDVQGNENNSANTITLGKANSATTKVNLSNAATSNKTLVPKGRALSSAGDAVESITYEFDVTWTSAMENTATGTQGKLTVLNTGNTLSQSSEGTQLVNVEIQIENNGTIVVDGALVKVKAIVTLNEPSSKAEYDAVAGKVLESSFQFTVVPN